MPEKGEKIWRKKKHDTRPNTPSQPKPTSGPDENKKERRRRQPPEKPPKLDKPEKNRWRKTIHVPRPETPVEVVASSSSIKSTPLDEDVEDNRSDLGSEKSACTPRRRSAPRPALSRYLSEYLSLAAKEQPIFSQPWDDELPSAFVTSIDPLAVLQAIHSYLCNNFYKPIPPEHHSGLLRIFEDYRKSREHKEKLEALLKETLEGYKSAEELWTTKEDHYQAEIRRLELLIALGSTGLAEVIAARKESIVKRIHPRRRLQSTAEPIVTYEYLSRERLDEQIKMRSQRVHLHRPLSPSRKMAALSRHFSKDGSPPGMIVGTPPSHDSKTHGKLSRKAESELDLTNMGISSLPQSVVSEFSVSGDPLPDEIEASKAALLDSGVECEAFVALRDLGTLVARRRGINADNFVNNLLLLFLTADKDDSHPIFPEPPSDANDTFIIAPGSSGQDMSEWTPNRHLRHIRSQPHLSSDDQRRRRHFSFEPGDDQMRALGNNIDIYQPREDSQGTVSPELHHVIESQSETSSSQRQKLNAELQRPSKIPTPLHGPPLDRVRRETSVSSMQSMSFRPQLDDRRDSRSSIVTAIRESSGSLCPQSASRSSSINNWRPQLASRNSLTNNLRQAEGHYPDEPTGSPMIRNSNMALAAARAADNTSAGSKIGGLGNLKSRAVRASVKVISENDALEKRI